MISRYTKILASVAEFTAVWHKKYVFTMNDIIESLQDPELTGRLRASEELRGLSSDEFEQVFTEAMDRLDLLGCIKKKDDGRFAWLGRN